MEKITLRFNMAAAIDFTKYIAVLISSSKESGVSVSFVMATIDDTRPNQEWVLVFSVEAEKALSLWKFAFDFGTFRSNIIADEIWTTDEKTFINRHLELYELAKLKARTIPSAQHLERLSEFRVQILTAAALGPG